MSLNSARNAWLGWLTEYHRDAAGTEYRKRRKLTLCPLRKEDGTAVSKREALRLLQPHVDRVNASIATPKEEIKRIGFQDFTKVWKRDCLALSKPSTQASMNSHVTRITKIFGNRDMRTIEAAEIQSFISSLKESGLAPKTVRNTWITIRLIWALAKTQGYVSQLPERPKLPKNTRKRQPFYSLNEMARMLHGATGVLHLLYRLFTETGVRQGEAFGLRLSDVLPDRINVNQTVWNGQIQDTPKNGTSIRTVFLSPQLSALLQEQVKKQKEKKHDLLFTTSTGNAMDANNTRQRHLHPLLERLKIKKAGWHAFRHGNSSALSKLRIPLAVIADRQGRESGTGNLTLDVYTHSDEQQNREAAETLGTAIEGELNSVTLTATQQQEPPAEITEALENAA